MRRLRDVAVIGGGPAGLSAAWSLVDAGLSVTLYEREAVVGGLLRTDALDGVSLDIAVQLLGSYYSETLSLAEETGSSSLLVRAPGRDALWRGGRAHLLSYGSVISMASSSALPLALKFQLASRYLSFLRRHADLLDPAEPIQASSLDRESIESWGLRELGREFVDLMVYPQLAAYYGLTPSDSSAAFYHALARAGLDLELFAVRGGMGALAAQIAHRLSERGAELRTGSEALAVRSNSGGVEVECDAGVAQYDAAILALPAPILARLIEPTGELLDWLDGVRFADEAVLALALDRVMPVDYFGLSFPRGTPPGDMLAAICVQGSKGAGLSDLGREGLVVVPAPAVMPRILSATPREALDLLLPSLELVYPTIRAEITRARVYQLSAARALFYPGYLEHLRRFDPQWIPPNFELAGDYLVAPTVEGAVRSGRRAAARLLHKADGTQ